MIENIVIAGIDHNDYPDFCDAYIESCTIGGVKASEKQLDKLNQDSQFVYDCLMIHLY